MWDGRFDTKIDLGPCTFEIKEPKSTVYEAFFSTEGKKWLLKDVFEIFVFRGNVLLLTRQYKVYNFYVFADFDKSVDIIDPDNHESCELVGTIEHDFIETIRESCD